MLARRLVDSADPPALRAPLKPARPLVGAPLIGGLAGAVLIGILLLAYLRGAFDPYLLDPLAFGELPDFTVASVAPAPEAYYPLPRLQVALDPDGARAVVLGLKMSLVLSSKDDAGWAARHLPRLLDEYTLLLSQMRLGELRDGAGLERLRGALKARAVVALGPGRVRAVLLEEISLF